jgi:hypothetical protein
VGPLIGPRLTPLFLGLEKTYPVPAVESVSAEQDTIRLQGFGNLSLTAKQQR